MPPKPINLQIVSLTINIKLWETIKKQEDARSCINFEEDKYKRQKKLFTVEATKKMKKNYKIIYVAKAYWVEKRKGNYFLQ